MDKTETVDFSPYYSSKDIRKKIDKLLHFNAIIQSSLGVDSTNKEKKQAHDATRKIKFEIATMDSVFAEHCFPEYK